MSRTATLADNPELCRQIALMVQALLRMPFCCEEAEALAARILVALELIDYSTSMLYELVKKYSIGALPPSRQQVLHQWAESVLREYEGVSI